MERRAFLALIASAPIAALAPLPGFLPQRRLPCGHPSCHCTWCVALRQYRASVLSREPGFDWYMDANWQAPASPVVAGAGQTGQTITVEAYSSSELAVDGSEDWIKRVSARLAEAFDKA